MSYNNKDYERIKNQLIDIYIYNLKNKYEILKYQGISKEKINDIMDIYQTINIKNFKSDFTKIKTIYKNNIC
jgi:hypothetical protein